MHKLRHRRFYNRPRRGFTLTEIAIVLGVIGTIVSAIFVTSSAVKYRMAVNQASDQLNQIVINIHNFYAGNNTSYTALNSARALSPATSAPSAADFTYYMAIFKNASSGIFPTDMVNSALGVNNIWNISSQAATNTAQAALMANGTSNVEFVIEYNTIDPDVCTDLVVHNSLPGRETGLVQIIITGTGTTKFSATSQTLPVGPTAAALACNGAAAGNKIDWFYNLNN